jgi:hypothetical protein
MGYRKFRGKSKVKGIGQSLPRACRRECPLHTGRGLGSIDAASELHRFFVGSRPLRGRLRRLRMTEAFSSMRSESFTG